MSKQILYPYSEGKQDLLCGEMNDCSVRALANCTDISYEKAHFLLQRAGRKDGCGFCIIKIIEVYLRCGLKMEVFGTHGVAKFIKEVADYPLSTKFNKKAKTLKTLLESSDYTKGSFIFGTHDHVFCVKDGKILDTGGNYSNSLVYQVFSV